MLKRKLKKGFTLIELLIVLSLIAIIAIIVIAAINPIEQANKARDARFISDSEQIVSTVERYYASRLEYPWVTSSPGSYSNDNSFGPISAGDANVGICGDASCSSDGVLITNGELKKEFKNRDFIKNSGSSDPTKTIVVRKAQGASSSVYACFVPLAIATKQKDCAEGVVVTVSGSSVSPQTCGSVTDWSTPGWYVCVPQ